MNMPLLDRENAKPEAPDIRPQPCNHAQPTEPIQMSVNGEQSEWQPNFCKTCGYPIVHLYMDIWIHIIAAGEH